VFMVTVVLSGSYMGREIDEWQVAEFEFLLALNILGPFTIIS
jgi:hypothetical protein